MINIRTFPTSGDAYDAVQCDETIKNGAVLLIADEQIIGLADTWPVAVTAAHGNLHSVNPDHGPPHEHKNCRNEQIWSEYQCRFAAELARGLNWPVHESFQIYLK